MYGKYAPEDMPYRGYEGKILSDAPNYRMDNLSCKLFEAKTLN